MRQLDWDTDGADWPHRTHSRFVQAAGLRWHVQRWNRAAPSILLLHGTGSSTHSWRDLAPLLAEHLDVLTLDLPGHAFTSADQAGDWGLPAMAAGVQTLLLAMDVRPSLILGHSAGAAIAARMCLDGRIHPRVLFSVNGALLPLGGLPGQLFSPIARLFAGGDWIPQWFARRAQQDPRTVDRLLDGTGSRLDDRGRELYGRLVRSPAHAAGALNMMANWDLSGVKADLPKLTQPLHLIVGSADGTVPPAQARQVLALLPSARLSVLSDLGHLAHEEAPAEVAHLVLESARLQGMAL